jgi:hypothetical protein
MSTSERATANIRPLPERDQPISEQYRIIAKEWVQLDGAARMLEASKDAVLSQTIMRYGTNAASMAAAERLAKSSDEWVDYVKKMVEARTAANLKKVHLEFIRMRHSEWIAGDANARAERRL